MMSNEKTVFRRCAFSKVLMPRHLMIRLVRLPSGEVCFDDMHVLQGRSVHIANTPETILQLKNPKKAPFLAHLLRVSGEDVKTILKVFE